MSASSSIVRLLKTRDDETGGAETDANNVRMTSVPISKLHVLNLRKKYLCPSLKTSYNKPIMMVRAERQYMFDETGERYLDFYNNVCHVGHCHPTVVEAGSKQLANIQTNTRYLHPNIVLYAQRLVQTLPPPLSVCFFVNSGSEANDLALRLAQQHTKNSESIVLEGAYHGTTAACAHLSPNLYKNTKRKIVGVSSHVHKVPAPDTYRGPFKRDNPDAGKLYADFVQKRIEEMDERGRNVAAFFCESIQGCGGQIVLPDGYLKHCYQYVRAAGGLCIADEVQTGLGRVGTHFWAFQTQGVVPDIVTAGKPLGNGFPMAAVFTTPEIAASFTEVEYFNTFAGSPTAMAIGHAVLEVIEREGLQQNALEVGALLMKGLLQLKEKHSLIGDVRGIGLFLGVEFVLDRTTMEPARHECLQVVNQLKDAGILTSYDGPYQNVLRLKGPICINASDVEHFLHVFDEILTAMGAPAPNNWSWSEEKGASLSWSEEAGAKLQLQSRL